MDSYATELIRLCEKCNYENADDILLNTLIRDNFIVGLDNRDLQLRILESENPKLTLQDVLSLAEENYSHIEHNVVKFENVGSNQNHGEELEKRVGHSEINEPLIKGHKANIRRKTCVKIDPTKTYTCNFCSSAFKHERNLFRHYKKTHPDESIEGRIICKEANCNHIFFSVRGWKRHRSLVHEYNSEEDTSENADVRNDQNVSNHAQYTPVATLPKITKSKQTKKQRFSCTYCKARFKHERNLVKHYKTNHADIEIEGRIRCEASGCDAIFFSSLGLRQHYTKYHLDLKDLANVKEHEKTYRTEVLIRNTDTLTVSNEFIETDDQIVLKEVNSLYETGKAGKDAFGSLLTDNITIIPESANKIVGIRPLINTDIATSPQQFSILHDIGSIPHQSDQVSYPVLQDSPIGDSHRVSPRDSHRHSPRDSLHDSQKSDQVSYPVLHDSQIMVETQPTNYKTPNTKDTQRKVKQQKEEKNSVDEGVDPGLCDICGKVFQDPNQHYRNVHATDRPFKCHLCEFSHPLKGHLAQHIRHKHMEAKFVCEVCGRRQRSAQAVKDHIAMVHQGLRPWPCPICPKTFAKKHYIDEHVKGRSLKIICISYGYKEGYIDFS